MSTFQQWPFLYPLRSLLPRFGVLIAYPAGRRINGSAQPKKGLVEPKKFRKSFVFRSDVRAG
jgi:hypothetical protein